MHKHDCFAYDSKKEICKALKAIECVNCAFYKTRQQLDAEQEATNNRLATLDDTTQQYITDKYHSVKRTWKGRR